MMKRKKRMTARILSIALCLSALLSGCSGAQAQDITDTLAAAAGEALGEYIKAQGLSEEVLALFGERTAEQAQEESPEDALQSAQTQEPKAQEGVSAQTQEPKAQEGVSEQTQEPKAQAGASEQTEAGADTDRTESPWINSNLYGAVKEGYSPSIKDDFYVAANKEWFDQARFRTGYMEESPHTDQQVFLKEQITQILTDPSMQGEDVKKVQNLYDLWLDWDARNSYDYVSEIRSHTDVIHRIQTMDELSDYLTSEESWIFGSNIAGAGLNLDQEDTSRYTVELFPAALTLGDPAEYRTLTEEGYKDKLYEDSVSCYMLQKIGYGAGDAEAILAAKYDFELKIAPYMMTYAEWNDPDFMDASYNPVTLEELEELSPNFPYAKLLETAGYAKSDYISLTEPKWLAGLNELYKEENLQQIKAYLIDDIASAYMPLIDEESYRYMQKLRMARYQADSTVSDEDQAYYFVKYQLSPEISRIYADNFVTQEKIDDIKLLIDETIVYYEKMLKENDWLSEETIEEAVGKLKAMGIRAVCPDKWHDRGQLQIGTKEEGETLISAMQKISRFRMDYNLSLVNSRVDETYWETEDITEVNSYYYVNTNEIYIMAGILGGCFYDEEMKIEEKMGAIGTIIGHEISHAFDTGGAQFSKDGDLYDWWTEDDYRIFRERTRKLVDYYSSFTVDGSGQPYNGAQVQKEAIADTAGMKCMLGIAKDMENFDYDLFFRSYAAIWREILTPEHMSEIIRTDTHALSYLRTNAVVQQFEEFYDTYDIEEGDGMYLAPEDRVTVW